ncbi:MULTISPECIES: C4-dicarboxylic acid transporter DauA [unclassified Neptuniibacter]|uniref:C4-dicarboxylic acid transporter DauA n=1 Tax=unclassified Neptuniibacter TaxID=2630693 RepID=UPI000C6A9C19|nr:MULTISPECIES: C4-dicarboxylic acid transporter DauA [unclassified Neptuniibacter]MAY41856.1 C4-dicarboxylic acid transporter DauA [Oceanospirillaceae bacterium]|tara:strand:+ start:1447 stop:3216 length:1770 start_codon:yes stop_codon:yes gene_type:complete
MPHRAHLFSLRIGHALRECVFESDYKLESLFKDLMAGISVGIIAIPLSMALAIASGVAPQYGLYTAFIAGCLIPLSGGSRYSISGPTAAFVVILYPVVQQFGLSGLLVSSIMAGIMLILMAILRLGRYIEYIPSAVTLGFTAGIAVVIAILQVENFFGLNVDPMPEHFTEKVLALFEALPNYTGNELWIGSLTLLVLLLWPKLKTPVPAHLPAVITGSIAAFIMNESGAGIETIGSTFSFILPDGSIGKGIPAMLPDFQWPWLRTQGGEDGLVWNWKVVQELLSAAFAIAMLGAIESLLCAVVLDEMSGKKHSANSELLGQGIGNVITPFFGGITATAAIARSAANFKAGAQSPLAGIIHAFVVLLALVSLSSFLSFLPMASMAALLLIVAWNMSEAPKAVQLFRNAPISDIAVFTTCFVLTVLFDMVIAITAGIVLASLLFMKQIADMTLVRDMTLNKKLVDVELPKGWRVYKVNGPLFFAAAERVFGELLHHCHEVRGIVIYLDAVSIMDAGGVTALNRFIDLCAQNNTRLILADFQFQPLKTLARSNFMPDSEVCKISPTLKEALQDLSSKDCFGTSDHNDRGTRK